MKEIIIDKIQIDTAKKIGADYFLLIQSLFDQGFLDEIDEFIEYGHKNGLKILLESHTKDEFENSLKTKADILGINNVDTRTRVLNYGVIYYPGVNESMVDKLMSKNINI